MYVEENVNNATDKTLVCFSKSDHYKTFVRFFFFSSSTRIDF